MSADSTEHRKLAAIMFTDMVGYSALAQRNEALALELLDEHRKLLRPFFPRFQGREVETIGDAFMVEFASALAATQCAVEIQRTLAKRNEAEAAERRFAVRIGIHIGDVVQRANGDVLGDGVNIAARIEPLAEAGGICVSRAVFEQVSNKLDMPLVKLGTPELKHIQVPMEVYRVVLPWLPGVAPTLGRPSAPPPSRFKRNALLTAVAGLAALAFIIVQPWTQREAKDSKDSPSNTNGPAIARPTPDRRIIAVLPLEDRSATTNTTFSEGMTLELMTKLRQIAGLRVFDGNTFVKTLKEGVDLPARWRESNIGALLKCRVLEEGENLRLFMQLIDSQTSEMLWAHHYDRDRRNKEILGLCSEVAQQVALQLKVELLPRNVQQLAKRPTDNPQAYRLYVLGRVHWNKYTLEGLRESIKYYNQAINLDTNYALAYSGLADSWIQLGDGEWEPPKKAFETAQVYVKQALDLDRNLGPAYVSQGTIRIAHTREWSAAKTDFQTAEQLSPEYADLYHFYGHYFEILGQTNEAIATFKKGLALDPYSLVLNAEMAGCYYHARQYAFAKEFCQHAIQLDPNFAWARQILTQVLIQEKKFDEALSVLAKIRTLEGGDGPLTVAHEACALGLSGRKEEARQKLPEFEAASVKSGARSPYFLAMIHIALGEDDAALKFLQEAHDTGSLWMSFIAVEPLFESLHTHERFKRLLQDMRLAQ